MNALEDQLREALADRAAHSPITADAWAKTVARSRRRFRVTLPHWLPAGFVIPAAAAAGVIGIVVAVTVTVHGISGSPKPAVPAIGTATPSLVPDDLENQLLKQFPASSTILGLKLRQGTSKAAVDLWLGYSSPAYWQAWITSGPQLCEVAQNQAPGQFYGDGGGFCRPLPQLTARHLARVTGSLAVGLGEKVTGHLVGLSGGQPVLSGIAAGQVTSVTAVLPDGRGYPGTVGTGRGFTAKAWAVTYPDVKGVRLVFRDASGHAVATLSAAAPPSPVLARPRTGGVTVFRYPAGGGIPAGSVQAYLIAGRVVFSGVLGPGVSPLPAAGAPVIGGLSYPLSGGEVVAGYAHADVARVVLRLRDGEQVTARTFAAGWPGSDLRLWTASLPKSALTEYENTGTVAAIATAYDAAGQVVGRVLLGASTP